MDPKQKKYIVKTLTSICRIKKSPCGLFGKWKLNKLLLIEKQADGIGAGMSTHGSAHLPNSNNGTGCGAENGFFQLFGLGKAVGMGNKHIGSGKRIVPEQRNQFGKSFLKPQRIGVMISHTISCSDNRFDTHFCQQSAFDGGNTASLD